MMGHLTVSRYPKSAKRRMGSSPLLRSHSYMRAPQVLKSGAATIAEDDQAIGEKHLKLKAAVSVVRYQFPSYQQKLQNRWGATLERLDALGHGTCQRIQSFAAVRSYRYRYRSRLPWCALRISKRERGPMRSAH